jgi:inorganic pyrophosphatase
MLARRMPDSVHCLVEIPKGSRNKYTFDPGLGSIKLDRFLSSSVVYPTDYGFIPRTLAPKGEPLDAMVCVSEPTFPGCVIPVRVVAVFRTSDESGQDDKLVCVPEEDPSWSGLERLDDLAGQLRAEIEHFWAIYKKPEGKDVHVHGWEDRETALTLLGEARERAAGAG